MKETTREFVQDQIVFAVILFIPFIPLIVQIDPIYLKLIPKIPQSIFDHLIQISATILGFTIVGIFYYLGKVDKERDDLVSDIVKKMMVNDQYPKGLNAEDKKQDENIKRKSKRIRMNMALISMYFGAAIALSLICIIYFSNGAGQILFFSIISLMLTPIYFFNKFWRDELMLR
jgi:hypothetical protein